MTAVVNACLGQADQLVKVCGPPTMGLIDDLIPDVVTLRWSVPASLNDVDALKAAVVTVSERAAVDHDLVVGIESWPIALHLLRSSPEATIGFDVPSSVIGPAKVQP